ncbi:hypothetical protein [Embleya scabrispora]|uniref:hypothetical protein n=1 Tax=Embleya scabrispora TaxID=159449 RepID=UPI00037D4EC6|nr:hypothetical protein [Embleya scabrispora]MYS87976.1 hypothetical protein [Streptomyces sp. SID5474]
MPLDAYLLMSALVRAEAARAAATAGAAAETPAPAAAATTGPAATSDAPMSVAGSGTIAADASTPDADPTAADSSGTDRQTGPQPPSAAPRS